MAVDQEVLGEKECPYCAETIKAAAIKCRFCRSDLTDGEPVATHDPDPDRGHLEAEPTPTPAGARAAGRSRMSFLDSKRLTAALAALCLLLACVAAYAAYDAQRSGDSGSEGPITSSKARDSGLGAATELTEKVLAYDWKTLDADMKEAEEVSAPSFRSEYSKAMTGVKAQAVQNQVKLTAKVVASSIVSASASKVEALLFVNQVTTAKGSKNQRLDQNRVLVTLTRDGGEWRVSKMKAF